MTNSLPSFVPSQAISEGTPTVLFSIGSWTMNVYSLCILLGFTCSILTAAYFWKREKYPFEILLTLIIITVPCAMIGARLGFIIERAIAGQPLARWWAIWEGGLSIQYGIILATIADLIYVYTKRKVIDVRKAASYIIPTILIGQFVGRWGNFSNHEVYGKIDWSGASSLMWGHTFASQMFISDSVSEQLGLQGAYRYPLFLYEGLANLVGYLLIVWVLNLFNFTKPGASAGLYLLWYGLLRLVMEPLREESYDVYKYLAVGFAVIGLLVFVYYQFFGLVEYKLKAEAKKPWTRTYEYANPELYKAHVLATSYKYNLLKMKTKLNKEN
ncbi:prolipoprotein diacylglyceryl transferase [Mycoplasma buteonis]|uniref:prolipoprotein diacylglyceryl transferase n=1 Tax=Mycoplasma buteonis TaxID=171280 RepID=UPI0005647A29|nr:prolipoprotein diacylglyceryl transferase [Mycoplasma buteonis]